MTTTAPTGAPGAPGNAAPTPTAAASSQAAPGPPGASPTVAADGAGAASGDAAAKPGETQAERLARVSRAGKAAKAAAARNRELAARNQQLQAQAAAGQASTAEIARLRELGQKDRLALARELGLDPKAVSEAALKENTPEAIAEARIKAAEARAEKVEREMAEWKAAEQQKTQGAAVAQIRETFVKESGDAAQFPNVARMPPAARLAWAERVIAEDRARAHSMGLDMGRYQPTNSQVLRHLEKLASQGAAPTQAPTASSPDASTAGSATPPTTLSNSLTSAKFELPANFDTLSDRDQKKAMADALRKKFPKKKA